MKPVPVAVSTNELLVATDAGEMLLSTGAGAGGGGGGALPTVIAPLVASRV